MRIVAVVDALHEEGQSAAHPRAAARPRWCSLLLVDARIVTLPVLMYNSIRAIILAALSVVYIVIAVVSIWLLDRLVGLEIFLKSK